MSGIGKNLNFITELLSTKGISEFQKFQIIGLLKKEVADYEKKMNDELFEKEERLLKKLKSKNAEQEKSAKSDFQFNEFHDPKAVQEFLIQFTLKNSPVKFLTHPIDVPFTSHESLLEPVNTKEYKERWRHLQELDSNLYWDVIYPFIFQRELNSNQKEGDFAWGGYGIKIGWQYPENLKLWCEEYFDNQPVGVKKLPGSMKVPKELLPKDKNNRSVKPYGKSIKSFEDIIELFNREIRFNGGELKDLIEKLASEFSPQHDVDLMNFSNVLPKFYVSTSKVKAALGVIFDMIRVKTDYTKVVITTESLENTLVLKIVHVDSTPSKMTDLKNGRTMGSISSIVNILRHVCDFSIVTNYIDSDLTERFDYLYADMKEDEAKVSIEQNKSDGFTFILKFLLPQDE